MRSTSACPARLPFFGRYFISAGAVEIFVNGTLATTLGTHAFFGEMALLDPSGRATGDVRAKGFCEGYHLSRENFHLLQAQFPDFHSYIENVARLRLERIEANNNKSSCPVGEKPIHKKVKSMADRRRKQSVSDVMESTGPLDTTKKLGRRLSSAAQYMASGGSKATAGGCKAPGDRKKSCGASLTAQTPTATVSALLGGMDA